MILFLLMLSMITLNVNGLHDHRKWFDFWHSVPCIDILCFQEIHLVEEQLFAFQLHAQNYNWFFSLGTSNSGGVCIGVKCYTGVMVSKVAEVSGYMLALDLMDDRKTRLINIYALNKVGARISFFLCQ